MVASSAFDLFKNSLEEILLGQSRWDVVVDQLVLKASASTGERHRVSSIGPTNLTSSIVMALNSAKISDIATEDHADWLSSKPLASSITMKAKSDIAIVGMAGRFPGAADHELLWKLLEKGLDVHREVRWSLNCL